MSNRSYTKVSFAVVGLLWIALLPTACDAAPLIAQNGVPQAQIVIGPKCGDVTKWVAGECQRYLEKLSGAKVPIVDSATEQGNSDSPMLLIGNPVNNPIVAKVEGATPLGFNGLKSEGFVLKTVDVAGRPAMVIGGNDDAGTMYATYELLERLGIVFQLTGDVIPDEKRELVLPDLQLRMEPALKRRGMHCCHSLRWFMGLDDFRQHIDQLAKLKMNHLEFFWGMGSPWCKFSYDGEVADVTYPKESGYLAWGGGGLWHTSTGSADDIRVGRECFPQKYLGPREFAEVETPADAYKAAESFLREVIKYAHSRNVKVCLALGEIPHVPANLVPESSTRLEGFQFENRYCGQAMPIGDPALLDIWEAAVTAMIETYPEADSYEIWAPEHSAPINTPEARSFLKQFEDKRKLIAPVAEIHRKGNAIPEDEAAVDSDFAQICVASKIIERVKQKHPDVQLGVLVLFRGYLLKALDAMTPKDVWLANMENCGNSRSQMEYYSGMEGRELIVMPRIDDDGCELHLQLNARMYDRDEIITGAAKYGLSGVVGQLNKDRGLEYNARYIADGAWDPNVDAKTFYADYLRRLYGAAAYPEIAKAFEILEQNDKEMVWWGRSDIFLGYGSFEPVRLRMLADFGAETPNVTREALIKGIKQTWGESEFWAARQSVADQHAESVAMKASKFWQERAHSCGQALDLLRTARDKVAEGSRAELDYVIFKTDNFIKYFDVLATSDLARVSLDEAWLAKLDGNQEEYLRNLDACRASLERADRLAREAAGQMIAYADVLTERYLLLHFNKNVIASLERDLAYVNKVIDSTKNGNLQANSH